MCLKLTVLLLLLHSLSFALPVSKPMEYYLITPNELQILKSVSQTLENSITASAILLQTQKSQIENLNQNLINLENLSKEQKQTIEELIVNSEVLKEISTQQAIQIQNSQQLINQQSQQITQSEQSLMTFKKEVQSSFQRLENEKIIFGVSGIGIGLLIYFIKDLFLK